MADNLNLDAERELFERTFGPKYGFAWRTADNNYKVGTLQSAWEVWQAARRAAPPVGGDGLLPLPEPMRFAQWTGGEVFAYSEDQYRQGQREAYEAGRRAAIAAYQVTVAEDINAVKERISRAAVPAQTGTQPADLDASQLEPLLKDWFGLDGCKGLFNPGRLLAFTNAARRAAVSTASAPVHRDLAGLNQFISLYCNGDSSLIACAEAAWYRCMMLNYPAGGAPSSPVE